MGHREFLANTQADTAVPLERITELIPEGMVYGESDAAVNFPPGTPLPVTSKVPVGATVLSKAALHATQSLHVLARFVTLHAQGIWGEVSEELARHNDKTLESWMLFESGKRIAQKAGAPYIGTVDAPLTKVYADVFSPRGDNYADEVILISAWLPDIEEVGKPVVPIYVYTVGPLYEDRRGVRQFSTLAVLNNEINGNKVINFENSRVLKPEQRHRVR